MKKSLILLGVLILNLLCNKSYAQQNFRDNCYFLLGNTHIFFSNNYIKQIDGPGYTPQYISPPFQNYSFNVYGEGLTIKVRSSKILQYSTASGAFIDSIKANPLYDLETLEFSIIKNDVVINDWKKIIDSKPYLDSSGYYYQTKGIKNADLTLIPGFMLYNNKLANNDSVSISFRQTNQKPFLNLKFKKQFADFAPKPMGSIMQHDKNYPLTSFIKNAIKGEENLNSTGFYNDQPGGGKGYDKIFPDTKLAYFFRKRTDINNDSAFEYRILEKNKLISDWKKSGNIIFFTSFKPGRRYRLDVRYTDRPQQVFTQFIDVTPVWYQSKWIYISCISFLILVSYIGYLLIKNRKSRRNQEEQKSKLKSLYAQLNPHFIFNALSSIQGLLNNDETEKANLYLSDFGALLRNTLTAGDKEMIPLAQDIQYMEKYISLERLRFNFNYNLKIDEFINTHEIEVLPLLTQPLIENAIKHGFEQSNPQPELQIKIDRSVKDIIYIIRDNGNGFNPDTLFRGNGLRLVKERIKIFNQTSKQKHISLKFNTNTKGTEAIITLINWQE